MTKKILSAIAAFAAAWFVVMVLAVHTVFASAEALTMQFSFWLWLHGYSWLNDKVIGRYGRKLFLQRDNIARQLKRGKMGTKALVNLLGATSESIDGLRELMERSPIGQETVRTHPDRHLYAVLKPTRLESIKRIVNIVDNYTDGESWWMQQVTKSLVQEKYKVKR